MNLHEAILYGKIFGNASGGLPPITEEDEDKVLKVVDGEAAWAEEELNPKGVNVLRKLDDYLFYAEYDDIDYEKGERYFKENALPVSGACSAFRWDNLFGRNYDWNYDDKASFVLKRNASEDCHASIGVAGSLISNDIPESGEPSELYTYLPFIMQDGINDAGLVCNINMLPAIDRMSETTGTNPGGIDIPMICLVRRILDECGSVAEAKYKIMNEYNIIAPKSESLDTEYHFMIADKDSSTVLEFVDNAPVFIDDFATDIPAMTNFYLTDWDGTRETLTPHAQGIERMELIRSFIEENRQVRTAALEPREEDCYRLLMNLYFTLAYGLEDFPWYSEFSGEYEEYGDLTKDSTPEEYAPLIAVAQEEFRNRQRDGKTWQTVHSVVYDLNRMTMAVVAQEGDYSDAKYFKMGVFGGFETNVCSQEEIIEMLEPYLDRFGIDVPVLNDAFVLANDDVAILNYTEE